MNVITHVGFADESNWNTGRFRSLGLVTISGACLDTLSSQARGLLDESGIQEFKWKRLKGAKERFAAEKLCTFAIENALIRQLRVDVLVWDIEDSRHKVIGRDDTENLGRMYYHLFRNVLRARWPDDAVWQLHPDEHAAMDWDTLRDCLENVSTTFEWDQNRLSDGLFRIRLRQEFGIEEIRAVSSVEHPILQIADLFAGLAVFSRDKFEQYQKWLQDSAPKARLFDEGELADGPSRISKERFQLLRKFDIMCKQRRMGVSLKSKQGLSTPNPAKPLNFWVYEAQHSEDKAPTRAA